jgi:hypothetical protein
VLFPAALRPRLADGSVTLAFRRWRRPTVKAGGTLQSPVGVLAIDAVDLVAIEEITRDEALSAGYASVEALLDSLRPAAPGQDPRAIHRIAFRHVGADPRERLRAQAQLSPDELDDLRMRLARMDARSARGPWIRAVLELIRDRPATRAADLAEALGRERLPFKADVRKLKELGLTESLEVGYRLSPRGAALLAAGGITASEAADPAGAADDSASGSRQAGHRQRS